MKFTLSWLKQHLETDASIGEITDTLTDLGLEVENVRNPAERLKEFTLAKVIGAEQHPNADKLRVCMVDTSEGIKKIVCGAPNARAGIIAVFAKAGTYIPGIDKTIQTGVIRGEESHGMICSEREMEISDDHEGIIELPSGEIGMRYIDWLEQNDPAKIDPAIEIAITPNRPDALGVRGIAFDLAARGIGKMKEADTAEIEGKFPCSAEIKIDADTLENGCMVFAGRMVRNLKNGPSPEWLQNRLRSIGVRPISTLVDITNYFTYDRNRPLHVFDADKIQGDFRIHRANGGETLVGLDEREYTFSRGQVVISDDSGIKSIAGIMGGLSSGCTMETKNVFIEAAVWDRIQVALTGRALKINSDARYRNERGIDPAFNMEGLDLATRMVLELCGGEASDVAMDGKMDIDARSYKFDPERVKSLVGMDISESEQRQTLTQLGFKLDGNMASAPSWRPDIMGEADLVEEIARIASLTKLEGTPMRRVNAGVPKPILSRAQKREQIARRTIAALGYSECVTYSFIDRDSARLFGGGDDTTMLANPINSEMSHMRPNLLPGLLQAAARNQSRGMNDIAIFEVAHVFDGGEPEQQSLQICGLLTGKTGPKEANAANRAVDLLDARADAESALFALGAPEKMQIFRNGESWWHPGRHGCFCLGPKRILGVFGELHPRVLRVMDVKGPAVAFTLYPEAIPVSRKTGASRGAIEISDLQAVERDFAFVVDADIEAAVLVNAATGADKKLIRGVRVFDEFSGGSLDEGKKSLAISVRLEPTKSTLTDADIENVSNQIIAKVVKATGGTLRK
ncbi:MAG: phenylalanine--tRNA ligase subunit beta [Roseovarius sp.]|nr:phenylalanine--tRNA ligase subunit beta [Roseovarius sp.]